MSQPPWAYRGAYIPFPLPIPAVTANPFGASDVGLCWADDWTPAILGALKTLTRPETWAGDPSDIEAAMLGAQLLLSHLVDGCGGGDFPFACSYDIEVDGAGWTAFDYGVSSTPQFVSTLVPGTGFIVEEVTSSGVPGRTYVKAACQTTFAPTTVTEVVMGYDVIKGLFEFSDGAQTGIVITFEGGIVATQLVDSHADADGSGKSIGWAGSVMADRVVFILETANRVSSGSDGSGAIRTGEVNGVGPTPCGSA